MNSSSLSHGTSRGFTAILLLIGVAPHMAAQGQQWEIYNNPAEFEKLSGASQNLLIAKFGPRPGAFVDQSRRAQGHGAPGSGGVLNVYGNVLVNDPTADLTAQDTQSETALVLGA